MGLLVRSALLRLVDGLDVEEYPGPSNNLADEPLMPVPAWDINDDFWQMQETDPTLTSVRNNLACEDDWVLDAWRAARLPQFKKVRSVLWYVAGPEQGGGAARQQLLVPESYRARALQ